ncbi:hypothetical protein [Nocardia sp. NBC_00511]|uniref:hypothetical protein n=1 Tax=Nocardia sp. NBC_00511 TaxID=2903591 RepID=UPI0030E321F7
MGQQAPAVIGLYFHDAGQWRRIAEFRLSAQGHATFRVVDPVEGLVARVWYYQGVDVLGEDRTVLPEDGPAFLRALLQPFGFRDYWFRDDSAPRSTFTRTGHAPRAAEVAIEFASDEKVWAAAEPGHECTPARDGDRRPAAWQLLDSDRLRF